MNKTDFVRKVASVLKDNEIQKPIAAMKSTLHISDDNGNHSKIILRSMDNNVPYTTNDVDSILSACFAVITDSIQHGEPVAIKGFGTFGLNYRAARRTKDIKTGAPVSIPAHYIPKFTASTNLKMAASRYGASLNDRLKFGPEDRYEDLDLVGREEE